MKLSVFYHHIREAAEQLQMPIEEVVQRVRSMGIEYAELDYADIRTDDTPYKLLNGAGMKISSIYGFYSFESIPDGKAGFSQVDRAVELGCQKVMIIPGFYSDKEDAKERDNMLCAVREMCSYAASKGITPTMEDFDDWKSPIATAKQLLWFTERVPELKITFDTGNFMYSQESELDAFAMLKDKIVHVHCKDRSLTEKAFCEAKACLDGRLMYPEAVGYGCIAMETIIENLQKEGYDGIYTIEHFGADNQLAYMEKSADWLKGKEV